MSENKHIVQREIKGGSTKFKDYFTCTLCKKQIIGKESLHNHLMGAKHKKNKLNEKGDFNLDKSKDEDDEEISKDDTSLSLGSTSTMFADIPSFSKLFRQNNSISCKETMNSELERRCKFNDLESAINYKFIDKTFLAKPIGCWLSFRG